MMQIDYAQYQDDIEACARAYAVNSQLQFSDLLSAANAAFMRATENYDEAFAVTFRTYLHRCMKNKFVEMIRNHHPLEEVQDNDGNSVLDSCADATYSAYRQLAFMEEVKALPQGARYVAEIFLTDPHAALGISGTQTKAEIKAVLMTHLRDIGWSWPMIWNSFRDLRNLVNH